MLFLECLGGLSVIRTGLNGASEAEIKSSEKASDTSENLLNIYIIYKYIMFILLYYYIVFE